MAIPRRLARKVPLAEWAAKHGNAGIPSLSPASQSNPASLPKKKAADVYDLMPGPPDIQEMCDELSYSSSRPNTPAPRRPLPPAPVGREVPARTSILRVFPATFISASCHDGTLVTTHTAQFRRAGLLLPTAKNEMFVVTLVYPDPTTRETKQVEVEFRINRQNGGTMCTRSWPSDLPFPECGNIAHRIGFFRV